MRLIIQEVGANLPSVLAWSSRLHPDVPPDSGAAAPSHRTSAEEASAGWQVSSHQKRKGALSAVKGQTAPPGGALTPQRKVK